MRVVPFLLLGHYTMLPEGVNCGKADHCHDLNVVAVAKYGYGLFPVDVESLQLLYEQVAVHVGALLCTASAPPPYLLFVICVDIMFSQAVVSVFQAGLLFVLFFVLVKLDPRDTKTEFTTELFLRAYSTCVHW